MRTAYLECLCLIVPVLGLSHYGGSILIKSLVQIAVVKSSLRCRLLAQSGHHKAGSQRLLSGGGHQNFSECLYVLLAM